MPSKNIHDKLFKEVFTRKTETAVFVETFLPVEIHRRLNLDSLVLDNNSFINEQLSEYFSDIVWTCGVYGGDEKIKISLLLEHKSYYDPNLTFQLLRYLTEAYEYQLRKAKKRKMSLVIPIVVYHGKAKWRNREMTDFFKLPAPEFAKYLPAFHYDLLDVRTVSDKVLAQAKAAAFLKTTLLLYRLHGDKRALLENPGGFFIFVKETTEAEQEHFARVFFEYLSNIFKFSKKEFMVLSDSMREVIDKKMYVPGSYTDTLLKEGRAEGRAEGRVEGRVEGMEKGTRILALRTTIHLIKHATAFSDKMISETGKKSLTVKQVARLRKILRTHSVEQSQKLIFAEYFRNIELTQEEKSALSKDIAAYYQKEDE